MRSFLEHKDRFFFSFFPPMFGLWLTTLVNSLCRQTLYVKVQMQSLYPLFLLHALSRWLLSLALLSKSGKSWDRGR